MKSRLLMQRSIIFPGLISALMTFGAYSANAAVTLLGNPYTPSGANFSISAIQGINLSTGDGSGGNPQVNLGVEFADGIGVSYTQDNGQLKHFGLGLYSPSHNQTESTGLRIQYSSLVDPNTLTIRLEDFDLKENSTFFNPGKVEPGILILGPNNTILANALPTDIWSAMSSVPGSNGRFQDVWDVSFAQLLVNLNLQVNAISGFILYADQTAGEHANSDPYFLVSVGNGMPAIPEPTTYFAGIAGLAFALIHHLQQRSRKRKTSAPC